MYEHIFCITVFVVECRFDFCQNFELHYSESWAFEQNVKYGFTHRQCLRKRNLGLQPVVHPNLKQLSGTSEHVRTRDDRIVVFYYPILSCFGKTISVSDPNPVLVEIILSVSQNCPKVYCDAQHTFLCCVYFASWGKITLTLWGKITARVILPLAEHDWLK